MRTIYIICGRQALLPRSLLIPLCYDPTGDPLCHGGFADVWKGRHQGRDIAAKVLKVYIKHDLTMITRVGCRRYSRLDMRTDELTMPRTDVLQGGCGMEHPSPSQRATTARRDDDRESIRDGIGVDGKREHQRVCEGGSQCGSVKACAILFMVFTFAGH